MPYYRPVENFATTLIGKSTASRLRAALRNPNIESFLYNREYVADLINRTEKEADKLENKIVRLENKRELAFEKLNALDFRRNKYDMALSWVGDWQFSEKGASEAPRLWVKEDMNGSIIDVSAALSSPQSLSASQY